MAIFKQTDDGLFDNPNDKSIDLENNEILKEIKNDTTSIQSILDRFGGQAIARMKAAEKAQKEGFKQLNTTLSNTTLPNTSKTQSELKNNVSPEAKTAIDPKTIDLTPHKNLTTEQKAILSTLNKIADGVNDVNNNVKNVTKTDNDNNKTVVKINLPKEEKLKQAISQVGKVENNVSPELKNNVSPEPKTKDAKSTAKNDQAKDKNNNKKKTAKKGKSNGIPDNWSKDKNGKWRDEKGRFAKFDKKGRPIISKNGDDSALETKENSRFRKILEAVEEVGEEIKDTAAPENIDPTIDAINEVSETIKSGAGIGKVIGKALKFTVGGAFDATKKLFNRKDNPEEVKANRWRDRFFSFHKKSVKESDKKAKKINENLEDIKNKKSSSDGFSGLLSGLFLRSLLTIFSPFIFIFSLLLKMLTSTVKVVKTGFNRILKGIGKGFKFIFSGFSKAVKSIISGVTKPIYSAFKLIQKGVKVIIDAILKGITGVITSTGKLFKNAITTGVKAGGGLLSKGVKAVASTAGKLNKASGGALGKAATGAGKAARTAGKFGKGIFKRIPLLGAGLSAFDIIDGLRDNTVDETGQSNGAKKIGSGVGSIAGMAIGALGGPLGMAIGSILGDIVGEKIGGWLSTVNWSDVSKNIENYWKTATSFISDTWNSSIDFIKKQWTSVTDSLSETWDKTKNRVSDAWNNSKSWVSDKWQGSKETVKNAYENTKTAVSNYVSKRLESAKNVINSIWNNSNDVTSEEVKSDVSTVSETTNDISRTTESVDKSTKDLKDEAKQTRKEFTRYFTDLISAVKKISINNTDYTQYTEQGMGSSAVPNINASNFTAGNVEGLNQQQTDSLMSYLGYKESGNNQFSENDFGYIGTYQFGAAALADLGLVNRDKLDAWDKKYGGVKKGVNKEAHKAFLADPSNWNNGLSKEKFLADKQLQDVVMKQYTARNAKSFKKLIGREPANVEELLGYLAASHLVGAGNAAKYIAKGTDKKDGNGTAASKYYREAIATYQKNKAVPNSGVSIDAKLSKAAQLPFSPTGVVTNTPIPIPSSLAIQSQVTETTQSIERSGQKAVQESQRRYQAEKKEKEKQREKEKEENKKSNNDLGVLLTQDLSDRKIAHIVTGGIAGNGQRIM
ncbi:hypothetical protein [Gallibacterium anatis]|uniref:hypothetical protein n=1 Tax=Gallibacterium anatis TaxID=750 RepID=UPI00068E4566|nr:hypothetical protein [Gallibacterium anatis]